MLRRFSKNESRVESVDRKHSLKRCHINKDLKVIISIIFLPPLLTQSFMRIKKAGGKEGNIYQPGIRQENRKHLSRKTFN